MSGGEEDDDEDDFVYDENKSQLALRRKNSIHKKKENKLYGSGKLYQSGLNDMMSAYQSLALSSIMEVNTGLKNMNKDYLNDLMKVLTTTLCKPEDMPIIKATESDSVFFLNKGIIEIYITNPSFGKVKN